MMRRVLLLSSLILGSVTAEIIDRIVVSVGSQVVTASEVRRVFKKWRARGKI